MIPGSFVAASSSSSSSSSSICGLTARHAWIGPKPQERPAAAESSTADTPTLDPHHCSRVPALGFDWLPDAGWHHHHHQSVPPSPLHRKAQGSVLRPSHRSDRGDPACDCSRASTGDQLRQLLQQHPPEVGSSTVRTHLDSTSGCLAQASQGNEEG